VRRFELRTRSEDAPAALVAMLDAFPAGLEEADEGDVVVLAGYADERPPGAPAGLRAAAVERGWEERWREYHRPVRVGRLWIGAPWHEREELAVVIEPGGAFGTGAHGSTRAALELLQRLEPSPALDLGCGSGVLAIAAARLGFGPLVAFDRDPLAVAATAENAARNGVAVPVAHADVLAPEAALPAAPLWLANLQLDLLERLLARPDVPPLVLASGLLADQTLGGDERAVVDGWAAELVRR
jgi:ribosomal protein L11 methyltransferase